MGAYGRFVIVEPGDGEVQAAFARATAAVDVLRSTSGVLAAKAWFGFAFQEDADASTPPDLQLAAVSAVGTDSDALSAVWAGATTSLGGSARYEIEGEAVRAAGIGWGGEIPADATIDVDEPVLVVITGDVHPEHVASFVEAGRPVIAQAKANPDYLGGCGLLSEKMLDITSLSCWRTARAARKFGFGPGAHRAARDADEAGGWHDMATNVYLTFRVLEESGTLFGRTPFASA